MIAIATLLVLLVSPFSPQGAPQDLQQISEQAKAALTRGDYDQAISLYKTLIEAVPTVGGLKVNLGMAYYMSGRSREAALHLQKALEQDPSLTPALLYLGASQLHLGSASEAVASLERYVALQPGDPQGRQVLGDALLAEGSPGRAAAQFRELARMAPQDPKAWHSLGRSYEAIAVEAFQNLESVAPESGFWLALAAESRLSQQQYQGAFFLFREAQKKQPGLRGVHVAVARIYEETGQPQWAEQERKKELALGMPDCQTEKLVCDFLGGRFVEVLEATRDGSAEASYWRARAANQLAVNSFARLGQLPPSLSLHQLRAEVHSTRNNHKEAAEEWQKALAFSPGDPFIERELALSLFLSRDYDRARPLVEGLLAKEPRSAQLNYLLGAMLLNREESEKAVPFLLKALQADSELVPAHASLGRAYLNLGRHSDAVPHLRQALRNDQDGSIHYQLAQAYRASGQMDLAAEALSTYREIQDRLQNEAEVLESETRITPP